MSGIGDKGFTEKLFPERGDMRAFSNTFIPETEIIQKARVRGQEIGTYDATPAVGSLLRYLTHLIGASSIVEISRDCRKAGR